MTATASPLLDRLNRWAEALPPQDSIPITTTEVWTLAAEIDATYPVPNFDRLSNIIDRIEHGNYAFDGHKIEVLK